MKTNIIPKNLDEAINILLQDINDENLEYINNISEENFICEQHHSTGRNIRNEWGLWTCDSDIFKFFTNLGIYHPDDMSSIILCSLYRTFHKMDLNLNEQIKHYIDYWNENDPKVNEGYYM